MVFSKVYCSSFAGARVRAEQSSFLSVNPSRELGSMLFAGSTAERAALGGQVASKLALQHFLLGAEQSLLQQKTQPRGSAEEVLEAIEAAFRTANSAVYEFGHKLSAGGRMAASVVSVFIRGGIIAAGRVGKGVAYLFREDQVFPFFAPQQPDQDISFVGSNSLVSVELASVQAQAGDVVVIFSEPPLAEFEAELGYMISLLLPKFNGIENPVELADSNVYGTKASDKFDNKACERLAQQVFGEKGPAFASVLALGPEVVFLEEIAENYEQA